MTMDDDKSLRALQILSVLEATTLVALVCIAVPLKHLVGYPVAVSIMGPLHGVVFVLYLWAVVATTSSGLWRAAQAWRLVATALVPFAGFANSGWIARKRSAQ
ncbi:DUF3817 domain-containing protein [Burkholderia oklahomensis]|uniref:DUF3817 domain-containing protein n=1 Tax=Burkholderia oklahomensis TaxID=342113 RepID=UPI000473275E|nr:DUF3817 domain-containing protein [Burkholderia oklahomensis]AJX35136.1 integral membrane domain protein [Burkholderia oklahomensis C6786]AOI50320.1 hypothetical protein WI23_29735 [Burkholderia oklahomensis C6786]KUY47335.1 hypothetical protein WI23_30020 [Burkholderia oklahomensis C6786]MBI0364253.1 DUF3817 domain-containing protein [Burkholderia oklahomensis]MDN7670978.1 DUF3817 domain-containing protein [Burkholderia oklahomensis]